MSQYGSVITLQGQAKVAAALAGTGTITLAQLAVGDGNGAPVTPIVTQTALVHEVWRGDVTSVARDPVYPTQVIVTATIPSTAGPATIRELGLYASDGQLVAVANYPATDIAAAGQGAVTNIDVQFVFAVDTAAPVTVQLNPSSFTPLAQMLRAPFIAIDAFANDPPANPALGALVVVGTAPTGAFVGHADKFAQFTGSVWLTCVAPVSTIVGHADGTYWRRTAAGWERVLVPAATLQPIYPEILTAGNVFSFATAVGQVVLAAGQSLLWRGLDPWSSDSLTLAQRTLATVASKTYHLRLNRVTGALALKDLADAAYNPGALAEGDASFDTTYDDALLARIVTSAGNVPTVTPLRNKAVLAGTYTKSSLDYSPSTWSSLPGLTAQLNWCRTPQWSIAMADCDLTTSVEQIVIMQSTKTRYTATAFVAGYAPAVPSQQYISGKCTMEARA